MTAVQFSIELVDWSSAESLAMPIRLAVFVQEQRVPVELEQDHQDPHCIHALARDAAGEVIGTGRLLPDGHIGRMAVLVSARGCGAGSALLGALVTEAARRGHSAVLLSSQTHAVKFYQRHGFRTRGAIYLDAGIEHIDMVRELASGGR